MTKNNIKSKKGFTIIEVVLVLAIAGLIFLMVFVALPALQRSQRDTQRRQDYADLLAAMNSYITNNNGSLPADGKDLEEDQYINASGKGPSGAAYTITVSTCNNTSGRACSDATAKLSNKATSNTEGTVRLIKKATCKDGAPVGAASTKAFVIYASLETGSYCQSSN